MSHAFQIGEFRIEPQLNAIIKADKSTRVEPKIMQVLVCLADRAGEVVPKERLIQTVWNGTFVTDDVLTRSVSELRKAFGDDSKEPHYIQTIPRSGYRLIAPVSYDGVNPDANLQAAAQSEAMPAIVPQSRSWANRLIWPFVLLVLASSGAAWLYFSRRASEPARPPMKVVPFTSFPGGEDQAAFSPDGNQIAFVWGEKADDLDIYVKSIAGERPLWLTSGPDKDVMPIWSPDGQRIFFVRFSKSGFGLYTVSALGGGPERKLLSLTRWPATIACSPDGKFIALSDASSIDEPFGIVLFSPETGEKRRLTSPPAQYWADYNPAFSPDGQTLAFVRGNTSLTGDIYLVPVTGGEPRRLTFDNARHIFSTGILSGLDWTADGREIVFSSNRGGVQGLWKIPVSGGNPERLPVGGDNAFFPSISRQGHRLAYTQIFGGTPVYRIELPVSKASAGSPIRLLESTRDHYSPQFSPDGKRIAFDSDRSGNLEIWMCDSEGQNLTQLTSFGGGFAGTPRWSPDGKQIAFDYRLKNDVDVYVLDVEGGPPRRLTTESSDDSVPSWSRDGRHIYFASNRSGDQQVWKVPVEGGEAVQVTKQGGFTTFESGDGKYVYYSKGHKTVHGISKGHKTVHGIWRIPVEGGEETLVLDQSWAGDWGKWAVVDDGIYFINPMAKSGFAIEFFSFATHRITRIAGLEKVTESVSGLAVSPDRRWILYTQQDPISSDIILVENFR